MASPNRLHDRRSFFKYMSASTARIVLETRSLRWSSPVLFNDPFDVPRELLFGVTPAEIVKALTVRLIDLIENPPAAVEELKPDFARIATAVKNGLPVEVKQKMIKAMQEMAETFRPEGQSLEEIRALWRNLLPDHRILCLTESPEHIAMWYHYADKYRGVVIELKCVDDLDSAWLVARPVAYPVNKPAIYTADGWADLMVKKEAVSAILELATYTKSADWSYEKEWRISSYKRPTDIGHFTDYKFDPNELGTIYIGPMTSEEDRASLVALSKNFPAANIVNTSIGMSRELILSA